MVTSNDRTIEETIQRKKPEIEQMSVLFQIRRYPARIYIIFIIIFHLSLVSQTVASNNDPVIVNEIGTVNSLKPFTISGSVSNPHCKLVGIEIFPEYYWKKAESIAGKRHAKGFRFSLLSVVQSITDEGVFSNDQVYCGVFLHIFNPDGTIAYQSAPPCPDHRIHFAKVVRNPEEKYIWSSVFNTDKDLRILNRGFYNLLVWNATNQVIRANTHIENIYDAKSHKIYPTTNKGLIWDSDNQKELKIILFQVK